MDTYIAWDRKDVPPDLDKTIYRRYHSHHYTAYRVERPGAAVLFQIKIGGGKIVYLDEKGREKKYYGHH